jgi:MFS family permease
MQYTPYVIAVVAIMLAGLVIFMITVKEKQWAAEMEEETARLGLEEPVVDDNGDKRKLSKAELTSLLLILASVALWYIGYNSITSKYSVYATEVLKVPYTVTLLVAQGAAIVSYIPVGMIASKMGRKKTILAGVAMLTAAFAAASFIKEGTPAIVMYLLFCLAGIGWATINVNSFPMVVELAKGGDVGKYTGFYYTASMAAQIVTPIFSGFLVQILGWWIFFPYAALFAGCAFVTMFFVKHGDAKPEAQGALEALAGGDD